MVRCGLVLSIALILLVVVPVADFQGHAHWARIGWVPFHPVRLFDIVLNVLLFVPMGFFVFFTMPSVVKAAVRAVAIAAPISLLAEGAQLYSHNRFPSATDVICNVGGAVAGVALGSACRLLLGGRRRTR